MNISELENIKKSLQIIDSYFSNINTYLPYWGGKSRDSFNKLISEITSSSNAYSFKRIETDLSNFINSYKDYLNNNQ